jgi:DNA-binding MarR family transcriptional regulator
MMEIEGKPADVLLDLYRSGTSNVTEIARRTSSTYAHTVRVVNRLEKMGVVRFERRGRTKLVGLTEVGRKIGEHLDEIEGLVKIARLSVEVEGLYTREVKGKLREEVDQRKVTEELAKISKQLDLLQSKGKMLEPVLRLRARMEEIEREVKGLVLG